MDPKKVIEKLINKYHFHFSETQTAVFINHLESFYQRLMNHESLGLELDDQLRSQISEPIWNQAQQFVHEFLKALKVDENLVIDEAEIFLVGTHLALL